jgi:catechol 2,3-dioxygenase-like lactoylglutathione lyase family enzyme
MNEECGSPLNAADHYHIGIVADDPAATMAQLTQLLGYEWCDQIGATITVGLPGGDVTVEIRTWYSKTTPRLEVVQSHPGTVWTRADSGLHHFGYWVDDVATTISALEAAGYTFEAAGKLPDGVPYWAYLSGPAGSGPAGPRLEIVSRQLQPMMERYFATGSVAS